MQIIIEDNSFIKSYTCSLVEILFVLQRKIGLVCWPLLHDLHAMDILCFNLALKIFYFLSYSVNLLGIFSSKEKQRAFERNPCFWNSYLLSWRSIMYFLWTYWKLLLHFFHNKYGRNSKEMSSSINYFMYF